MSKMIFAAAPLALLLASCGGEAPKEEAATKPPTAMPMGAWEVTATVAKLQSTDNSTPATKRKQGETWTRKACLAKPEDLAKLLLPEGENCTAVSNYARQGRINSAFTCRVAGKGDHTPTVAGLYTADTFEAEVSTASMFSGDGDYQMTETMQGKRLGDCAAAG